MSVTDRHVLSDSGLAKQRFVVCGSLVAGLAGIDVAQFVPGERFIVEEVNTFCRAAGAGTATVLVKIGTTAVNTLVAFTADTRVAATMAALATRKGGVSDVVHLEVTTQASTGDRTNFMIEVIYRYIAPPE